MEIVTPLGLWLFLYGAFLLQCAKHTHLNFRSRPLLMEFGSGLIAAYVLFIASAQPVTRELVLVTCATLTALSTVAPIDHRVSELRQHVRVSFLRVHVIVYSLLAPILMVALRWISAIQGSTLLMFSVGLWALLLSCGILTGRRSFYGVMVGLGICLGSLAGFGWRFLASLLAMVGMFGAAKDKGGMLQLFPEESSPSS